ncbi:MAG: hypothetical protein HY288_05910 [Planctomycetia bacterium]|nr:hypothetical protein [Planctomycetia bacterium]
MAMWLLALILQITFERCAMATEVHVKANWDVGTANMGGQHFTLTYRDAHVTIASRNFIEAIPAPTTANNGFDNGNATVQHGFPDDTLTVDWMLNAATPSLTGTHHIGVDFQLDNTVGGGTTDVRVTNAQLTNVSGSVEGGGGFETVPSMPLPGPPSITYGPVHSADVTLSLDNPALTAPVMFSGVTFYSSGVEPALTDLTAANFGGVVKTLELSAADFTLPPGGSMDLVVPNVAVGQWLIGAYTTSWDDPLASSLMGAPVTTTVDTWFAGQVVPEPSSWLHLVVGTAGVVVMARTVKNVHFSLSFKPRSL